MIWTKSSSKDFHANWFQASGISKNVRIILEALTSTQMSKYYTKKYWLLHLREFERTTFHSHSFSRYPKYPEMGQPHQESGAQAPEPSPAPLRMCANRKLELGEDPLTPIRNANLFALGQKLPPPLPKNYICITKKLKCCFDRRRIVPSKTQVLITQSLVEQLGREA